MAQPRTRGSAVVGGGDAGRATPKHLASANGDGSKSQAGVRRRPLHFKAPPCGQAAANARSAGGPGQDRGLRACRSLGEPHQLSADSDHLGAPAADSFSDYIAEGDGEDGLAWLFPAASELDGMQRTADVLAAAQVEDPIALASQHSAVNSNGDNMHERKLKEQNQRFWETAKQMDKALMLEEAQCAALATQLSEAEANSRTHFAQSENRVSEVVKNESNMQIEVDKLRKAGRERVVHHAGDMQMLSDKLCNAQRRCLESEAVTEKNLAEVAEVRHQLREEARQQAAVATKLQSVLELESRLNLELEANMHFCGQEQLYKICEAEVEEQKRSLELSGEELRAARHDHFEDMEIVGEEIREMQNAEVCMQTALQHKEAEIALLHEELGGLEDLRCDAAEASVARAEEHREVEAARRLQKALAHSESNAQAESLKGGEARRELCAFRAEVVQGVESLRRAELECSGYAELAANTSYEAKAAKLHALNSDELQAALAKRVAQLSNELENSRRTEDEQRKFWVASHSASVRSEEQALASASKLAGQQMATEQLAARDALTAARKSVDVAKSQHEAEVARSRQLSNTLSEKDAALSAGAQNALFAETRLASLEAALACEWAAAQANSSQFAEMFVEADAQFLFDLDAANHATKLALEEEEKEAVEARSEAVECTTFQQQLSLSQDKVAKLNQSAQSFALENDELATELAQARDDAKRHARNATEFRAELVATKRDLAKQRHAERDLKQAVDEMDTLSAKFTKAHRGREVAEHEVKQGQSRQALLERQVRDLQTRMTAERLARPIRARSPHREASADTWLLSDQQGLFQSGMGSAPSKSALNQPPAAAAVNPGRRNNSVEMNGAPRLANDTVSMSRAASPSAAAGMGRSQSLGALTAPSKLEPLDCDGVDTRECTGQLPNGTAPCDALGGSRNSPHGSLSHPPRPPQAIAPRMGWATHARSRQGTPEKHREVLYSPGATSSSIDRVVR